MPHVYVTSYVKRLPSALREVLELSAVHKSPYGTFTFKSDLIRQVSTAMTVHKDTTKELPPDSMCWILWHAAEHMHLRLVQHFVRLIPDTKYEKLRETVTYELLGTIAARNGDLKLIKYFYSLPHSPLSYTRIICAVLVYGHPHINDFMQIYEWSRGWPFSEEEEELIESHQQAGLVFVPQH